MLVRTARRVAAVCLATLTVLPALAAAPAVAGSAQRRPGDVIDVFPGRHALKKALAKAQSGDQLLVHGGKYYDSLTVSVPGIEIKAARVGGQVTIVGGCRVPATITVTADGVKLTNLRVIGGLDAEIDVENAAGGLFSLDRLKDSCGTASYGIHLSGVGQAEVHDNVISGFSAVGIFVENVTDTEAGSLLIAHNEVFDSNGGIKIRDSAGGTISLFRNHLRDNDVFGIMLENSDGVAITTNHAKRDGTYGIELDANSDGNQVRDNWASGNTFDLANEGGSGNCFRKNHYETSEGDISC
jgi:parallel beta-helix repeat protein